MPRTQREIPKPDLHGAIRKIHARVKYVVNIYDGKTLVDHHELENPLMPIMIGDDISLWTDGIKNLTVKSVAHKLDRSEWHWLVQTLEIYCVNRES